MSGSIFRQIYGDEITGEQELFLGDSAGEESSANHQRQYGNCTDSTGNSTRIVCDTVLVTVLDDITRNDHGQIGMHDQFHFLALLQKVTRIHKL